MSCCSNSNNVSLQTNSHYLTAAYVAGTLGVVAALVAAVAVVALFVPVVGIFILGASFTAALATKICIGAAITAVVSGLATIGLCYLRRQSTASSTQTASRVNTDQLKDRINFYNAQLKSLIDAKGCRIKQNAEAAFHVNSQAYPAIASFQDGKIHYVFYIERKPFSIICDPKNKTFTVNAEGNESNKKIIVEELQRLRSDFVQL